MKAAIINGMKFCGKCQSWKPLAAFHRCTRYPVGYTSQCKDCKREWRKATAIGLAWKRQSKERWRRRNLHKARAHLAVCRAVKKGQLQRGFCVVCGAARVEAHHPNGYGRRLDVVWLCPGDHRDEHGADRR